MTDAIVYAYMITQTTSPESASNSVADAGFAKLVATFQYVMCTVGQIFSALALTHAGIFHSRFTHNIGLPYSFATVFTLFGGIPDFPRTVRTCLTAA